jgi:hypothetical protein
MKGGGGTGWRRWGAGTRRSPPAGRRCCRGSTFGRQKRGGGGGNLGDEVDLDGLFDVTAGPVKVKTSRGGGGGVGRGVLLGGEDEEVGEGRLKKADGAVWGGGGEGRGGAKGIFFW